MSDEQQTKKAVEAIDTFHTEIDHATKPLENRHQQRLQCRLGCAQCCMDELSVFEIEAASIRQHYPTLLEVGTPHVRGACAFLDDHGGCRIYEHRPYVCRTQGLPLRWLEEAEDEMALIEYRDICPLNEEGGEPIEHLEPEDCWEIGPREQRLAALQQRTYGNLKRVNLRDLFKRR